VSSKEIQIAGMEPFSTVDWPDKIAVTLFLQGCPWQCEYCHNFDILDPKVPGQIPWSEVLELLEKRQGLIDGVVFSGGEPLMQPAIIEAAQTVKDLGFLVGLHTGGAYPKTLEKLIPYLDWVGFDIKAPWEKYDQVTLRRNSAPAAQASLKLLLDQQIDLQTRTTFDKLLLTDHDLKLIDQQLKNIGAPPTIVQEIRTLGTSDEFKERYRQRPVVSY
jgi:pyruvate formate lyase activating enzyme